MPKSANSKVINVLTTIDTDRVRAAHPSGNSKDPKHPTPLSHDIAYMVATGATINSGQGTGDLDFNANIGDIVRSFALSGSNNFEDAVLLYGMPPIDESKVVFGPFKYSRFTKAGLLPNNNRDMPLPANVDADLTYWFYSAEVERGGVERFKMQFGLYTRTGISQKYELFGYFEWDPTITVGG